MCINACGRRHFGWLWVGTDHRRRHACIRTAEYETIAEGGNDSDQNQRDYRSDSAPAATPAGLIEIIVKGAARRWLANIVMNRIAIWIALLRSSDKRGRFMVMFGRNRRRKGGLTRFSVGRLRGLLLARCHSRSSLLRCSRGGSSEFGERVILANQPRKLDKGIVLFLNLRRAVG
ncbi:MAG TPA: hypothetical protein VNL39_03435 [Xanthobacteraceae bacterium]|nr:hypothetical protein [Xanthobacteraceae bacterium]